MNLPTHLLSDSPLSPITNVTFSTEPSTLFATATTEGWVVYGVHPLRVISRRGTFPGLTGRTSTTTYTLARCTEFPNSSLRIVLPLAQSNLLFLVGGPPSPLYPPNKVLFWDDKLGRTVAELEFREDVRGLAARRDRLVVVLRRRVLIYVLGEGSTGIWREGVYETTDNPSGAWSCVSQRAGGPGELTGPARDLQVLLRSRRTRARLCSRSQAASRARCSSCAFRRSTRDRHRCRRHRRMTQPRPLSRPSPSFSRIPRHSRPSQPRRPAR